jgi:hypothetical protein
MADGRHAGAPETDEKKGCASRTPNPNRETSALGHKTLKTH